jgi:glycosyltransferase involved in cell wall biosynthesis
MPVYNEAATVVRAVDRVLAVEYPCPVELIIVDDGSTDATPQLIAPYTGRGVTIVCYPVNRGKGAAVRTGAQHATGTHVVVLDADLEYSPADIPRLLVPVLSGVADHVFGCRIFGLNTRFPSYRFAMGGRLTTVVANMLFDSCLTDMHTCLKLMPVEHFRALMLSEEGFGLDTELTARMLRAGIRPYEVPITYNGRAVAEGKKITWRDGWACLMILATTRLRVPDQLPAVMRDSIEAVVVIPAPAAVRHDAAPDAHIVDAAT